MSTKQLLCRGHSLGQCSFGTRCIFSHDPTRSEPIPDGVCILNLRSNCINECKMVHRSIVDILGSVDGETQMRPTSSRNSNEEQDQQHKKKCFVYYRSQHLTCSVCLDVVLEKPTRKARRFGLLNKCSHVFCIECIRTWRSLPNQANRHTCPECRTESDFYIASELFYDDKDEEKAQIITEYMEACAQKHCQYFNNGTGNCQFGPTCLYKHEYWDGLVAICTI